MIKKLLTLMLLTAALGAQAQQKITIIWPFSIGSNQANTVRAIINEANAKQTKYEFLLDNRPGGGGAVAAKHVLENPSNTVLAMSSSFFIRPNFDAEVNSTSYSVSAFQPVLVQATGSPIAFLSKTYSDVSQLKNAKEVTVGIAGIGTISHLVAHNINEQFGNVKLIPYPSMIAADKDVMGQHIAASTDFVGDITGYIGTDLVNVLGITGTKPYGNLRTLEQQGIRGFENLVANYGMYVSAAMPEQTVVEIHDILNSVNRNAAVAESYSKDVLTPVNMSLSQSKQWYNEQARYWRHQASKTQR